jgi:hypothetical protein
LEAPRPGVGWFASGCLSFLRSSFPGPPSFSSK